MNMAAKKTKYVSKIGKPICELEQDINQLYAFIVTLLSKIDVSQSDRELWDLRFSFQACLSHFIEYVNVKVEKWHRLITEEKINYQQRKSKNEAWFVSELSIETKPPCINDAQYFDVVQMAIQLPKTVQLFQQKCHEKKLIDQMTIDLLGSTVNSILVSIAVLEECELFFLNNQNMRPRSK